LKEGTQLGRGGPVRRIRIYLEKNGVAGIDRGTNGNDDGVGIKEVLLGRRAVDPSKGDVTPKMPVDRQR